jgi:uncharacterized membrane protein YeaQ/YmgE (transglycosylase-associated protein family)
MAIGAVAGLLASVIFRVGVGGILRDALLGLAGIFIGAFGTAILFPRNTVTTNSGLNPNVIAIITAALLPLFHELYRRFAPSKNK